MLASAAGSGSFVGFRGDVGSEPVQLRRGNSGVNPTDATNGAAFSADTWTALGATLTASNSVAVFVDGAKTTDTATVGYRRR
jgi:hypothetical protein